jgi:predicted RNase H-like HicB family nuclease
MKEGQRYIDLTFVIAKEDNQYAARCVELGTASCGDTFEEALANLHDAVSLDLDTLEAVGERACFFRDRGIRVKTYHNGKRTLPVKRSVYPESWTATQRVPMAS